MQVRLKNILSAEDLKSVQAQLDTLRWADGSKTAGAQSKGVKKNLQADLKVPSGKKMATQLKAAIASHPSLQNAAIPKRFSPVQISRTGPGGGYGNHADNPVMFEDENTPIRTDMSFTLFLSPPEDYEGGELVIETAGQTQTFKPDAGDLVLYLSTHIHRVEPVTKGERIVCIGWIESRIRDPRHREIIFDLNLTHAHLLKKMNPQATEPLLLSKTLANLTRLWVET